MKKAINDIFTDGTNHDVDFTKVLGAMAFVVFLVLSFYSYGYKGSNWDPVAWSTSVGILLAAVGGVSKIKDYTHKGTDESRIT